MKATLIVATTLIALALIGDQDYQDAQAEQAYQCDMIEAGHWPQDVNPSCKEVAHDH